MSDLEVIYSACDVAPAEPGAWSLAGLTRVMPASQHIQARTTWASGGRVPVVQPEGCENESLPQTWLFLEQKQS